MYIPESDNRPRLVDGELRTVTILTTQSCYWPWDPRYNTSHNVVARSEAEAISIARRTYSGRISVSMSPVYH